MNPLVDRQISYISRKIPYYRNTFGSDTLSLDRLPVLSKKVIRNNYEEFISDDFFEIRSALARQLRENPRSKHQFAGPPGWTDCISLEHTNGSTGIPFTFAKSMNDRLRLARGIWKQRQIIDPHVSADNFFRLLHISRDALNFDPWSKDFCEVERLYAELKERRARWIHGHHSMFLAHMDAMAVCKIEIPEHVKFLECSGAFLPTEIRHSLQERFSTTVLDQYGLMEVWAIATTCLHGTHHVIEDNVFVEILDEHDQPLPAGIPGRIVVTSLQERLLPFVRYDTGDFGLWAEKTCPCPLSSKVIEILNGRPEQLVRGCSDRVFGNSLLRDAIYSASAQWDLTDLTHIQVSQTHVDVFVVAINSIRHVEPFMDHMENFINDRLRRKINLVCQIDPDGGGGPFVRRKPWLFRCEMVEEDESPR